ncbi:MAG: peptide chain release factor N(5)-glutamine methyltransferase [Clostridiales bacterium]|nr:peptide chain release factor N(5)-glutamine methyltransferase [Clostridiales bacterium]
MTRKEVRELARKRLRDAGIEDFEYETWLLLDWKLGVSRADYFMNPEEKVPEEQWQALAAVLKQREKRIPLQYLMGRCEFMGYSFMVDERVLIPRQDTECLVELAVESIRKQVDSQREMIDKQETASGISGLDIVSIPEQARDAVSRKNAPVQVLDLCTGSGCIGISVRLLCPEAEVTLSDVSADALAVAGQNARTLGAEVSLIQSDLFENIDGEATSYDYILSNPPYIPSKVIEGLMPEVRDYEPRLALDGTVDGLYFYREIAAQATRYLRPGGWLMLEIGQEQGEALRAILQENEYEEIAIRKDLAGRNRIALGRRPG